MKSTRQISIFARLKRKLSNELTSPIVSAHLTNLIREVSLLELRANFQERILSLSSKELELLERNLKQFWKIITPRELISSKIVRIGSEHDGGYLLAEDYLNSSSVLSIGVGDNNDVDYHLAENGLTIYEYDHTVEEEPKKHQNIHFFKIGLGQGSDLISLGAMLKNNNVKENSILLCDVEGAEFYPNNIFQLEDLEAFDQIVIELHDLQEMLEVQTHQRISSLVRTLTSNHTVVHVHANNRPTYNFRGISLPSVLEVTLLKNSKYKFGNYVYDFPNELDTPNNIYLKDPTLQIPRN